MTDDKLKLLAKLQGRVRVERVVITDSIGTARHSKHRVSKLKPTQLRHFIEYTASAGESE